ncbi:MAG: recombinase XerD [Candidatus Dadabacteria bacterium]|nr:MAG: recombinase XerD [Candidatus Dadabacteria bacterium]
MPSNRNTDIESAIGEYLEWAATNDRLAPSTLRDRRLYLGYFLNWCSSRKIETARQISPRGLEEYLKYWTQYRKPTCAPLSSYSIVARLIAVKSFLNWATTRGLLERNPAEALELPRPIDRAPVAVYSPLEIESILSEPDVTTKYGIRDRAILELFYGVGMRRGALRRIKLTDLDTATRKIHLFRPKTKHSQYLPIGDRARFWLRKYLGIRHLFLSDKPDDGILFLSHLGGPLSASRLSGMVGAYIRKALPGRPGACHALRHSMATAMHDNGADLRDLQVLLGHAHISTTQRYIRVSTKRLEEVHRRTHPMHQLPSNGERIDRPPAPPGQALYWGQASWTWFQECGTGNDDEGERY